MVAAAVLLGCAGRAAPEGPGAQVAPEPVQPYRILVGAESDDDVALIEFRPCPPGGETGAGCGARVVREYPVGVWPTEIEGPHGVVASPDGQAFYVTLAHGMPFGHLQKFDLETGELLDQVQLGMFPASIDIAPSGAFVYVINFNFEDPEMRPSSLSVVDGLTMTEVARPVTCRMPHGSRVNPAGTAHYSGCMMNDLLVEVDALSFDVTRTLNVAPPVVAAAGADPHAGHARVAGGESSDPAALPISSACSPTWAQPSADGRSVFVACNKSNEIVEVDVGAWRVTRRWSTPAAPYNIAVTPDRRLLVATQKGPGTITVWRLDDATLLAEIPGTRKVASGIVTSPDSRYAFATLEGVGGDPGTVDIIDLETLQKVASVDVGKQAGGVAVVPGQER